MNAPSVVRLLAETPEPTDHAGMREFVAAACDLGLPVAMMCAGGAVAADFRPDVAVTDRVPVPDRRGKLPSELMTTDADIAQRWLDTYIAELIVHQVNGNRVPVAVAVGVGDDELIERVTRPGVLPGPVDGFVTVWRRPADVRPVALKSRPPTVTYRPPPQPKPPPAPPRVWTPPAPPPIFVTPVDADPWDDTLSVRADHLGSTLGFDGCSLDGYWTTGRGAGKRIYRVVTAIYGSHRGYARLLDPDRWIDPKCSRNECWVYAPKLSGGQWLDSVRSFGKRMSERDFRQFGALYGRCIRCRQLLTAPTSIARGCGDVCAEHLNAQEPEREGSES